MSAVVILFAVGIFLVYDAWTAPPGAPAPPREHRPGRWSVLLVQAGLGTISPRQLLVGCAGSGLAAAMVVMSTVGSATIALLAFAGGAWVPVAYLRSRRLARRRALRQSWPEAVELLAGAVRSGDTLPAAIAVVAERGPDSLRSMFRALVADHRVSGDFTGALARAGAVLADPTADRVVVTLTVAHRVGGHELGRVLRTLAAFLREDLAVRKEIEARQSWGVVAARVASAAPWLVLLLVVGRPEARAAFDSVTGFVVVCGGAVATIVGYRLMIALGRLPDEPRVLGTAP